MKKKKEKRFFLTISPSPISHPIPFSQPILCLFVCTHSHLLKYLAETHWVSISTFHSSYSSLQQDPSGRQGTLSILWHSPPLGLVKTFYITKLNGRVPVASGTCRNVWQKRLIGRRVQGALSFSAYHHSPFFFSFFSTFCFLAADLHVDEGVNKKGTE